MNTTGIGPRSWKTLPCERLAMGILLTLALQAGEIDAAYGLPYISYPLFENEDYVFTSTAHQSCVLWYHEYAKRKDAGSRHSSGECYGNR